ncbi:MAG: energy transducer TonB [Acidobacteriota bacterium]
MDPTEIEELTPEELEELLAAETEMYSEYFEGSIADRRPTQIAILLAVLVHALILWVTFPEFKSRTHAVAPAKIVYVKKWRPPPPKKKEPPKPIKERKLKTRKIPIPDPTPDEPEPIKEPEPEPEPEPLPPDAVALIGIPDLPPVGNTGPLIAGVAGVSNPTRTVYVEPGYPELARKAGIQGKVFLQAIILSDGTVGDISVLSTNAPDLGFEESAIDAVKQWRYKPGEQNNRAVDVLFNIVVTFTIQ